MSIKTVGVLGCGLMGSDIAQTCAAAGYRTIARDVSPPLQPPCRVLVSNRKTAIKRHSVMLSVGFVAALTAAAAASVNTDGQAPSVGRQSVAGARPDALADGKRLYDVNCANCHGAGAQGAVKAGIEISIIAERGGKLPPDLTDPVWDHGSTDTEIVTLVKKGIPLGMMAPYEGRLSDVEIENVVAYVRSLSSSQTAATSSSL